MHVSLEELRVRNVGPLEDEVVDLRGHLVGIVGENGSGKTTLVEAIYSALTGDFRQYESQRDYIRDTPRGKANSMSITLKFRLGETRCVLHRTVALDGQRTKSSAKLVVQSPGREEETTSGVKEVGKRMSSLIGLNVSTLGQYSFIAQDKITSIVRSTDAERTRSLHEMWGLERFEKSREALHKEISALPSYSTTETVEDLEREKGSLEAILRDLLQQCTSLEDRLKELDPEQAELNLIAWESAEKHRDALSAQDASVGLLVSQKNEAIAALAAPQLELKQIEQNEQALKPQADAAEKKVREIRDARALLDQRTRLADRANQLSESLHQVERTRPEVPPAISEDLPGRVEGLYANLHASRKFLADAARFRSGDSLRCPTCGQEVKNLQASIDLHQSVVDSLGPMHAKDNMELESLKQLQEKYRTAQSAYDLTRKNLMASAAQVLSDLGRIPTVKVEDASPEALAALEGMRETYHKVCMAKSFAASTLLSRQLDVERLESAVTQATSRLAILRSEASQLSEALTSLTPEILEDSRRRVREAHDVRIDLVRAKTQLQSREESLRQLGDRLERARALQARMAKISEVRDLFSRARDVLHRDQLPRVLAARYLNSVNDALNRFLGVMQSPFSVEMVSTADGYRFQCRFQDGVEREVTNLSGGQKACFSVAFLMAVGETLGGSFGILCLDEPTASLDDGNVRQMAEVFEHVREYASSVGSQIFVVTHRDSMRPAFDRVLCVANGRVAECR